MSARQCFTVRYSRVIIRIEDRGSTQRKREGVQGRPVLCIECSRWDFIDAARNSNTDGTVWVIEDSVWVSDFSSSMSKFSKQNPQASQQLFRLRPEESYE